MSNHPTDHPISEAEFRKRVHEVFDLVARASESLDPDLLECQVAQGALTWTFRGGSKVILSAQPSVRQLWLANASQGVAYHFNWKALPNHLSGGQWRDDKTGQVEVFEYLKGLAKTAAGVELSF